MRCLLDLFCKKDKKNIIDENIKCPRCKIIMRKITKENITIDVCDKCQGMWLDRGEMNNLVKLSINKTQKVKSKTKKNTGGKNGKKK